ncbi:MAG TPA: NAD kinase [Candidatus Limosilactobacillus merdipullorum]|uniref:NAD kinase n=1 Tax=Candidatus Limosilactobacillus merdipullorum TaxID=2838653 RepID=A0A9D1U4K7_9LACO|nr:NAD kinase [Candidatus Limosilactobacillus merdipullorum]
MKITVVNYNAPEAVRVRKIMLKRLADDGFDYDQQHPDLVISIGGDGTLLSAFHMYEQILDHVRFVGIHTGHLGFYTDWRNFELDDLIHSLKKDEGQAVSYPLLNITQRFSDGSTSQYVALNESTIQQKTRTMVCDVYLNNRLFEGFRGDGICVSTPTGSTAYNKSVGGAVMDPTITGFQAAEMASINNRVFRSLGSPIILGQETKLTVRLHDDSDCVMTCDRQTLHWNQNEKHLADITYRVDDRRIKFAKYRHTNFWDRVHESFIGEVQ